MKKLYFFALMSMIIGMGTATAQTENTFEGEITSNLHSVQKMKTQVLSKNLLTKMILKKVTKQIEEGNYFNGKYTATTIVKGNKIKTITPYNNSVTVIEKDGDMMTTTTYFPHIKKGYTQTIDMKKNKEQTDAMQKGDVKKTGETMTILGYNCDIYTVTSEQKMEQDGAETVLTMNHKFAVCSDPSCPGSTDEVPFLQGVKGAPLKYINNTVTQTSQPKMLNLDFLMYMDSEAKSIKARPVDDAEFAIPSEMKISDANKDATVVAKIMNENTEFMKKKKLWEETPADEVKIYDNLQEEWEY